MTDHLDRHLAEQVILPVGQGLAGGHHDALSGMNAHRIKVFHIADGDAIVVAVAHHLVFDLFPALEILLDQDLRGVGKAFGGQLTQFLLVAADPRAQPAQGVGDADHHRVADLLGDLHRLRHRAGGFAAGVLDAHFLQPLHKALAVLSVDNRRHLGAQHPHIILLQDALMK